MNRLFTVDTELEKKLHPKALVVVNEWIDNVQHQVKLNEVNDDDLNFLSYDEKIKLKRVFEISECLNECIDINNQDRFYDMFLIEKTISQLREKLLSIEFDIVPPLRKIYRCRLAWEEEKERKRLEEEKLKATKIDEERKILEAKAEAERQEKKKNERWSSAVKKVNPPIDDAKKYFYDEEYNRFIQEIHTTIEVYLEKGEEYLNDFRTFDYRQFLRRINSKKEEDKQKRVAKSAAQKYNQNLNKEVERLKVLLFHNRTDHESYFKKHIEDHRYIDQSFADLLTSKEERDFNAMVINISKKKLDKIVSSDFSTFIESKCWQSYFLMPTAEYSLEGMPCLDFVFEVFAVVELRVWLKPGQKSFGHYVFKLPWSETQGYYTLKEPEFLGYYYFMLTPDDLDSYVYWRRIPLVLLEGLLSGETKPDGVIISSTSDNEITYKIPKFEGEVNISDSFADYLKSIGTIDKLASIGIISQKVADIVQSEPGEYGIKQNGSYIEGRKSDSNKARAFQLFEQGKGPSSPEVKALGLHKSTRFKYYNQYLAVHKQ